MERIAVIGGSLVIAACTATPSLGQGTTMVYGGYNLTPPNLATGQTAPLQLDRSGNLEVDCILGCSSGTGGVASQGAPASIASAWPVYLSLGGSAVTPGNAFPVADVANGAPISAATMPGGGSGSLGWLSAIENQLSVGTITVTPASGATFSVTDVNDGSASSSAQMSNNGLGIIGWLSTVVVKLANTLTVSQVASGTVVDGAATIGTASSVAVPATTGVRYRATLTNTSTTAGNTVWCRGDGGSAVVGTGIALPPNGGGYEWIYPLTGTKPAPAITCLATLSSAAVALEYVQ